MSKHTCKNTHTQRHRLCIKKHKIDTDIHKTHTQFYTHRHTHTKPMDRGIFIGSHTQVLIPPNQSDIDTLKNIWSHA